MGENKEVFYVCSHENVRSLHKSTLEFTKECELSLRGDCILGVCSSKCMKDFDKKFLDKLRNDDTKVCIKLKVDDLEECIYAKGSAKLSFESDHAIIIRKSDFVCGRTFCILADKSAKDISRKIVDLMREKDKKMKVEVELL
jgi:uncharacterized protein